MAAKNMEQTKAEIRENAVRIPAKQKGSQKESMYTPEEFTANADELFGVRSECVFAALKQNGILECTKAKAAEIVKAFRGREVK